MIDFTNWKPFKVSDIFEAKKIKTYSTVPIETGKTPFISSSAINNGVTSYCNLEPNQKQAITVSTNGGCFDCFWHPYGFCASKDVEVLYCKPNHKLTTSEALFICTVLSLNKQRFGYAYKPKNGAVWNTTILLPCKDDKPDWECISSYSESLFNKSLIKYNTLIKKPNKSNLKFDSWYEFTFNNIINIKSTSSGIDKIALNTEGPKIYPYVTRSEGKPNGIDCYVARQNKPLDKGKQITLGLDTQTIFYQEKDFYTGQNIQILSYSKINKFNAMFLISVLRKTIKAKFSWGGNGATLSRLKAMKVALPAIQNSDGSYSPDWDYMESYIKSLPYSDKI